MRFLFCPLASHGYVYPMIGIAQELRKRGHTANFVTGPDFDDILAREGLKRIPLGSSDDLSFEVSLWWDPLGVAKQILHVELALRRFPADAIVTSQLAYGPLIAGERHSIPTGILGFATYLWPVRAGTEDCFHLEDVGRRVRRHQGFLLTEMTEYYNHFRQAVGLPLLQTDAAMKSMLGCAFLVQSVSELEGEIRHLPPQVHLVGSCLWEPEEEDNELLEWLAAAESAKEQIIYVQHGRLFHLQSFWPYLVDSLKSKPVRVVASVGRSLPETGGAHLQSPTNFVVRDHVRQGPVLARASAAVSTGNTTAVLGALSNGVPMLLTPGGGEQVGLARRCVRAGAALCVDPTELESGRVDFAQALEHVLSDTALRNGAQHIQRALRGLNGHKRAAYLLEHMGRCGGPIYRP